MEGASERKAADSWASFCISVINTGGSFFGAGSLFDASTASGLSTRLSQQHSLIQQSQYMPRLIELRRCCTNRLFGRHPRPFLAVGVFGVIDVVLIAANSIVDLRDRWLNANFFEIQAIAINIIVVVTATFTESPVALYLLNPAFT
jgi:hypothetical protein